MKHQMKLSSLPFSRINSGEKVIETRTNDEKRQLVNIDDEIEFTSLENSNKKLLVKVIGLSKFKSFKDLYSSFDHKMFGHPSGTTLDMQLTDIRETYSKEKELKYGALGIHIKLIK